MVLLVYLAVGGFFLKGFSTAGDELHQEDHIKEILVGQILGMYHVLKRGNFFSQLLNTRSLTKEKADGDFVVKMFEICTPFTAGLLYILYSTFERISIVKPYSSRPGNSERWVNKPPDCPFFKKPKHYLSK